MNSQRLVTILAFLKFAKGANLCEFWTERELSEKNALHDVLYIL